MRFRMLHGTALVLLLAGFSLTGCARKRAPEPVPTPPTTQPAEPAPTPRTSPPAETAPPPVPQIGSGDFQPAFFDFDSYALRADARGALDRNAKLLRDNPSLQVTIEGHCDERGTVEYNQALGERRAMAARDYLVAGGISTSRLQIISYGKERPFETGSDEASWQQNRRAHFTIRS